MSKPIIVIFPGYDGEAENSTTELKRLLKNNFTVITPNYPYYLKTAKAYSLSELLDYLDLYLEERSISKFHLVGFSMGGFVASAYSIKYPIKIRSLTLLNSSVYPVLTMVTQPLIGWTYHLFKTPALAKIFSIIYCSPILSGLVKKSPLPPPRTNFPTSEAYPVFGTLVNVLHEVIRPEFARKLLSLNLPKRALLFDDDISFPPSQYEPILSKLGMQVTARRHGGHAGTGDYWSQVANYLKMNLIN